MGPIAVIESAILSKMPGVTEVAIVPQNRDALMEENEKSLRDYLAVLRRRRQSLLGAMATILLVSVSIAFGLPPVYRSTATILIEQPEIPEELVRSTVTSYADQRIQMLNRRVMITANLLAIIERNNLYPRLRAREPTEVVIEEMRADINQQTISADVIDPHVGRSAQATAFTLSYENQSPTLAQRVANELVSLYLNENLERTRTATQTAAFLQAEAEKLSAKIAELENKIADFKERNAGRLPELTQLNLELMNRTDNEVLETEREIRSLEQSKIYLQAQLAQISPNSASYTEAGQRILGPTDRLKLLQTEIVTLISKYGPEHPDVMRVRREIDALKLETGSSSRRGQIEDQLQRLRSELVSGRQKYSEDHPDIKRLNRAIAGLGEELKKAPTRVAARATVSDPDNPAYIQLQAQLQAATTDLATQRSKAETLRAKRAAYEEKLTQTPQAEREYLTLTRDYENSRARYQEITAKQVEAQLGQSMETERRSEKFTLIEAPLFPEQPARPNRIAILLLGVVLSFAGGLGTAFVRENIDTTIRGRSGVIALAGAPPLAVIPCIQTEDDVRTKVLRRRLVAGLAIFSVALSGVIVHVLIVPLDVLWIQGLRQLGL